MVEKNGVSFVAIVEGTEGYYDDAGDWVSPSVLTPESRFGVILPLSEDDLKYDIGGTYSTQDRKLYTLESLKKGQKIQYKGVEYTVQTFKDYTDYTDVFIYVARWAEQ